MNSKITKEQYSAAFRVAVDFYHGRIRLTDGSAYLHEAYMLNIASARDYLNDFKCMMNGQVFHRAMSADAVDYFFDQIAREFGLSALQNAVKATDLHIHYYEGLGKGRLYKLRDVCDKYRKNLEAVVHTNELEKQFQQQVADSIKLQPEARLKRLANAPTKPKEMQVTTSVFIRNPDVVAQVLHRANGICEACLQPAPFFKKSDGLPYLEVHHKIRLADTGDDSVENALALCPNCHRKFHYGL